MTTPALSPIDPELQSLVDQLDHHSPVYAHRFHELYAHMHAGCPVLHSERYGGFHAFAGYEAINEINRRTDAFSHEHIVIPKAPLPQLIPAFVDPPDHAAYRQLLAPALSPGAMEKRRQRIREVTNDLFAGVAGKSEFDTVLEVAQPLMGIMTMEILGFDPADALAYAEPIHNVSFMRGTYEEMAGGILRLMQGIKRDVAVARQQSKGLMGALTQVQFRGRLLTDQELEAIALNLLLGGLGTTQGMAGSITLYLGRNPQQRQLLIDEPGLLGSAVDELLRYYAPTQQTARTVTQDIEIDGVSLRRGDRVLVIYGAGNLDPQQFPNPGEIDFRRNPNRHMTFSIGPHRCLGSNLARAVLIEFTAKLLEVAPNFTVIEERVIQPQNIQGNFGYHGVPIRPRG